MLLCVFNEARNGQENEKSLPLISHLKGCSDLYTSESDIPLTIPKHANVKFSVVDGIPGLSIATRKTRTWTPVASRTRARTRTSANNS